MCMCQPVRKVPPQGDKALTPDVMAAMSEKERSFWKNFMELGMKEIKENKSEGNVMPFAPSSQLQKLFKTAVSDYEGKSYCQIHQLMDRFSFADTETTRSCDIKTQCKEEATCGA